MTRSLKKGYYVNERLYKKVQNFLQLWEKKVIKVWDRACTILPEFVWFTFAVHNWKTFISLYVSEEMIGHRLGEFVPTRLFRWHPF